MKSRDAASNRDGTDACGMKILIARGPEPGELQLAEHAEGNSFEFLEALRNQGPTVCWPIGREEALVEIFQRNGIEPVGGELEVRSALARFRGLSASWAKAKQGC